MVSGSLRNPYAVVTGALTVMLLGGVALSRIPTDILPAFQTPAAHSRHHTADGDAVRSNRYAHSCD